MKVLGLDFETLGARHSAQFLPTEIGMVFIDVPSYRVLRTFSAVINPEVNVFDQKIMALTRLTPELISGGIPRSVAADQLFDLANDADLILTWNGEFFDIPLAYQELEEYIGKVKIAPSTDLKLDLGYKRNVTLLYAGAEVGYLNPAEHTALGDVLTMLEIARRRNVNWADLMHDAQYPYVEVIAQVGPNKKDQASEVGYAWDPERKIWAKWIRQHQVEIEKASRTFIVTPYVDNSVKEAVQSKGIV